FPCRSRICTPCRRGPTAIPAVVAPVRRCGASAPSPLRGARVVLHAIAHVYRSGESSSVYSSSFGGCASGCVERKAKPVVMPPPYLPAGIEDSPCWYLHHSSVATCMTQVAIDLARGTPARRNGCTCVMQAAILSSTHARSHV